MKKYRFTGNTLTVNGVVLHEIQAVRDFGYIFGGDIGGYIESEYNLSHSGECWIGPNVFVYGNAVILGDCVIESSQDIQNEFFNNQHSIVICNSTMVTGNARIYGENIHVEHTRVSDSVYINGRNILISNSIIKNDVEMMGAFRLYHARIRAQSDFNIVVPEKDEENYTIYNTEDGVYITSAHYDGLASGIDYSNNIIDTNSVAAVSEYMLTHYVG